MGRKHVIQNIVGQTAKYDLAKVSNSYTLNMMVETVDGNESFVNRIVRPIPGLKKICDIEGRCRGTYTVSSGYKGQPTTYMVFGSKLYVLTPNDTAFPIANMANFDTEVHFAETGNSEGFHSHLVMVDGHNCYSLDTQVNYSVQSTSFKQVQLPYRNYDTGEMIKPTHIAYLYGYIVVNDEGSDSFYISYQFPYERNDDDNNLDENIFMVDSEEWGYKGQSEQSYWQPDNTTALVANGTKLFTFGEKSYQIFQYTNDVNVPFNSPDTAASLIGLRAVNSLCQIGGIIIWLGSADIGNDGVYMNTGGTQAQRVSTVEIERQISKLPYVKDARAQIWQDHQHIFYVLDFPSGGLTLCYDLTEKTWTNRASLTDKNELKNWRYTNAVMDRNGRILHAAQNCLVCETEEKWNEHDGRPIVRTRRGGIVYSDNSNFYIDDIEVITNNGQYSDIDYAGAKMSMRFSSDGSTWSDQEVVSLGNTGDYDYDCVFYSLGMARYFTVEFSCSDNVPFALYGIRLNTDTCAW